ncbi:hypothetical protein PENTCL1PPCAC_3974, partial [Pristionchus entomophagus]
NSLRTCLGELRPAPVKYYSALSVLSVNAGKDHNHRKYRQTVANAMSGDRIDECKREIDGLNSEIISLCKQIDPLATGTDIPVIVTAELNSSQPKSSSSIKTSMFAHRRRTGWPWRWIIS